MASLNNIIMVHTHFAQDINLVIIHCIYFIFIVTKFCNCSDFSDNSITSVELDDFIGLERLETL